VKNVVSDMVGVEPEGVVGPPMSEESLEIAVVTVDRARGAVFQFEIIVEACNTVVHGVSFRKRKGNWSPPHHGSGQKKKKECHHFHKKPRKTMPRGRGGVKKVASGEDRREEAR